MNVKVKKLFDILDTCINGHSHMSQEFYSNEDAVVPTESEINPR